MFISDWFTDIDEKRDLAGFSGVIRLGRALRGPPSKEAENFMQRKRRP